MFLAMSALGDVLSEEVTKHEYVEKQPSQMAHDKSTHTLQECRFSTKNLPEREVS
jgi:hypothetical protein